jgi:hypothetical protein
MTIESDKELFNKLKKQLLNIDPVVFCQNNLILDGQPFRLEGNGYRPFADIYRYIGVKALEPNSKPVIIVKGRQVGATTMASALEMYFMGCGLFGDGFRPPIRVIHAFPQLEYAAAYSKTKLNQIISSAVPVANVEQNKASKPLSCMQALLDKSTSTNDSLHFKQFIGGNHLWIESVGLDGDRIMGRQLCLETELPTPSGFIKLKNLQEGDQLFDDQGNICNVIKLHPINTSLEAYRITFDDGTTVDACSEHLWLTYTQDNRLYNTIPNVKNTKEVIKTLIVNNQFNHSVLGYTPLNSVEQSLLLNADLLKSKLLHNSTHRFIINIERIESKPMRCLTVDSYSHLFLITRQYIPTHNTADVILFDECQKTTSMAIGNSLKVLTTAKYGKPTKGVQVYFGTPRRKGSDYQKMWTASSQQYYYLGCEKCGKHFPLYTPGTDDWEKIWLYGFIVRCTNCGHEQDKREAAERGKWVALRDLNDEHCLMVGFHINQLYMPFFTKEDIIKEKPGIHPINTERVYMNEVLGEFFQGDASPITPEDIREKCADAERKFSSKISPPAPGCSATDQIVVLGIDYGAKSDLEQLASVDKVKKTGQSYSTAVVLSAKGPNLLHIEFATKFKRNDMESKKGLIDQLIRQYSVQLAVGDIGYSNDFSTMLHNTYGDKYIVSRAHNKVNHHVKYSVDAFPKEIVFERDYYISELFDMLKNGNIRFPFGDYEKIAWLIEHCSSMEIKPIISRSGDPSIHYVKGSTPNDGFMALLNAYLAFKFIITNGFTNNNPLLQQFNFKNINKPVVLAGYIPRRM